jgi:4-amino-4-deoxy-L-arabinose transferase-like glycosyltransferase
MSTSLGGRRDKKITSLGQIRIKEILTSTLAWWDCLAEKEITFEIKDPWMLALIPFLALVLFLNLQVTMSTPISFGDEGFHTMMAQWMAQHMEYPVLRPFEGSDVDRVTFERPPVWNLLEGGFMLIFGTGETFIKIFTPIISTLTGLAVYVLAKRIYNERVGFVAAVLMATMPSFVTYSVFFYTDILYTLFFSMAVLLFVVATKENSRKMLILSAIFSGICIITKTPSAVLPVFFIMAFLYQLARGRKFAELIRTYTLYAFIMIIVSSGFLLRSLYYYNSPYVDLPLPFFKPIFSVGNWTNTLQFSARNTNTGTESGIFSMGVISYLSFAYGNIWLVILTLTAGIAFMVNRKDNSDLLILLCLVTISFIIYMASSRAEDLARDTLSWVPIIAIICGIYVDQIYDFLAGAMKNYRIVALFVFAIIVILGYMAITEKLPTLLQVKQFSPEFFNACDWVKSNLPQNASLFTVWSHRATYNCQRNVVGSFPDVAISRDLNHTLEAAKANGLTHIFIQKFSIDYQSTHLQENYDYDFVTFLESNPNHFKKVFENGASLSQCVSQGGCDGNIIYEIVY